MPQPKHFTIEHKEDVFIISPLGSIGALDSEAIRDEWADVLARLEMADVRRAVIDLNSLEYFGSIVLELIVVLWKRLSSKRGSLAICNVSPVGLEILQAAKFETIWPIVPGLPEAIDAVRDEP
ncbi:MAG: hypothetical protein CMJ64_11675 [Planctomycetaceae bacterium]|nr:hypothetical protein [Planctomycetaceae bacterium]